MSDIKCTRKFVEPAKIQALQDLVRSGADSIETLSDVIQAAGNESRLKILWLLTIENELCPCDLSDVLGVSVPAISQQLQKLRVQGLVSRRRDGVTIYYSLADTPFTMMLRSLFETAIPETVAS
jgi:ArsR family transcriptional regulator, lead/cadmium/zinc/bismuth-responsive transcriptional repressor